MTDWSGALARALTFSPFLAGLIARFPEVTALLAQGDFDRAIAITPDGENVRSRLRRRRAVIALAVAIGDLAGQLDLAEVVARLSAFADEALDTAIREAITSRHPEASSAGFTAIALGKHGSRELNYSSDIDPILLYDPAHVPVRGRDDAGESAERIARGVVDLLQSRDADGYVLRVDLRLRPAAEATSLALPVDAAISHYESSALAWERAAFIRARAAAGDLTLGQNFLDAIRPFVWRRSVDFGAVQDLRSLSHRIRAHQSGASSFGPGFDLKRGRGGIREIEFFVQIHQLIHGGRDPALRAPATRDGIAALAGAGWLSADRAAMLDTAYVLFRTIEHRLQMIDDRQTHTLPADPEALDAVARLHGMAEGAALLSLLAPHVEAVGAVYDDLDGPRRVQMPVEAQALSAALTAARFADPKAVSARIAEWRGGRIRALRSDAAQTALEAVLPHLIEAFGAAPDPDRALAAFDAMLAGLPTALNLFRLLEARPGLLALLVDIMSFAPTLAASLGRTPALLDRLLDASARDPAPPVAALAAAMTLPGGGIEAQFDQVRRVVNEQRFALGVQIVEGGADPIAAARGYARVAEAAVDVVASSVVADFAHVHGRVLASELLILGLGRLGGLALTHASDLDLIYLFSGDFAAESDGARPLGATHYYNRLGARLTAGLSVPTSAGSLYEVDTRLRPSGGDGPLIVSVDSFARYQRESAWTWEHMALARARPVFGSASAIEAVKAIIAEVLHRPRDRHVLRADIVKMRADMAMHKPPAGPLDVKLMPGGLIDLEFAVHFHQLANGIGFDPDLTVAVGELVEAGLVAADLKAAHDLLTRLLVTVRLLAPSLDEPDAATQAIIVRACGMQDWAQLLDQLATARQCVAQTWEAVRKDV